MGSTDAIAGEPLRHIALMGRAYYMTGGPGSRKEGRYSTLTGQDCKAPGFQTHRDEMLRL